MMNDHTAAEQSDDSAGAPGEESITIAGCPFDPKKIRARDLRKMRKELKTMPDGADEEDFMMDIMEDLIVRTIQRDDPDADAEAIADGITLEHLEALDNAWKGDE